MTDDRTPPPPTDGRQAARDREDTAAGAGATAADDGTAARPPLVRSDRHRVVAGVCGGLGRHLDIDPVVFRVVIAVLCLSGGLGLFLYGLAWLIVPAERSRKTEIQRVLTGQVDAQSIGAVLLTVIGTGVFFSWMDRGNRLFPLLLLGVLVFFAVRYDPERRRRPPGEPRPRREYDPYDRHVQREEARAQRDQLREEWRARRQEFRDEWRVRREEWRATAGSPTGYRWDPRYPDRNPYAPYDAPPPPPGGTAAWWQREDLPAGDPLRKTAAPEPPVPPTPPERRPRHHHPGHRHGRSHRHGQGGLGSIAFLLSLGAGAAVWAMAGGQHGDVRLTTVLAAVLLVQGLALLLASRRGRARGLVLPALLTTLALAAAGTSDLPLKASVGDRAWAPASASQVRHIYSLGAGNAALDLGGIDPGGGTVTTGVRLGAGSLTVTVPGDVRLRITVHSAAGDIELPNGIHAGGLGNEHQANLAPLGPHSKGTITLDLQVGLGDVKVVRR
ncbi:PspC domain-containing protein [Streptomyces sp. NPDC092296]|uniref:PspC domain-containing protein n=1 Tax=Streptomyces sp. NPDC092296 TaxID=3366012 RepID=UPI0037F118F7